MSSLTKKIAERFITESESVDLSDFSSIEDAAAEILAKYKGDLFLSGLTSLSPTAAKALASHEGDLNLCGLTKITTKLAQELVLRNSGFSLRSCQDFGSGLNLTNLTIQTLSKHGSKLYSMAINPCVLDDATCVALSKFSGEVLLSDYMSDEKFSISEIGLSALATRKVFHASIGNLDEESICFLKRHCRLEGDEIWTRKSNAVSK